MSAPNRTHTPEPGDVVIDSPGDRHHGWAVILRLGVPAHSSGKVPIIPLGCDDPYHLDRTVNRDDLRIVT